MSATTVLPAEVYAPGLFERLRSWWGDVWVMTRRNLIHISREPMQLSDVTIQPVLFTLLFIYVFGSAMVLAGGSRLGGDLADGWFVAPTVFGGVDQRSALARDEVFGPVQALLRFSSDEEVLGLANDSPYGLAAYVFTNEPDRLERLVGGIDAGVVMVNGGGRIGPATPFGGVKQSGFGREGGRAGYDEMVRGKTVLADS